MGRGRSTHYLSLGRGFLLKKETRISQGGQKRGFIILQQPCHLDEMLTRNQNTSSFTTSILAFLMGKGKKRKVTFREINVRVVVLNQ